MILYIFSVLFCDFLKNYMIFGHFKSIYKIIITAKKNKLKLIKKHYDEIEYPLFLGISRFLTPRKTMFLIFGSHRKSQISGM